MFYAKYVETSDDYYIYSSKQQKAPVPKYVCFYNGSDKKSDRTILKLSDSFPKGSVPDIESKVTMININYGHNKDLMEACQSLKDYSWLVNKIRSNKRQGAVWKKL